MSEQRLIDANKIPWCNYDLDNYHSFVGVDKEYVDEMPTIEVEPVRHGRWIYENSLVGINAYHCSECNRLEVARDLDDIYETCPYCNCGAKMDGVLNDD